MLHSCKDTRALERPASLKTVKFCTRSGHDSHALAFHMNPSTLRHLLPSAFCYLKEDVRKRTEGLQATRTNMAKELYPIEETLVGREQTSGVEDGEDLQTKPLYVTP